MTDADGANRDAKRGGGGREQRHIATGKPYVAEGLVLALFAIGVAVRQAAG